MKRFAVVGWAMALACWIAWPQRALAKPLFNRPEPHDVSVVMLSDFHFDPFHDPSKYPALRGTPIAEWAPLLNQPDSATQAGDYAHLQSTCHARGEDSSWAVLKRSLEAAHTQQPRPLFVTVSGDLLTHNFECRLKTIDPGATPEAVSSFATKTLAFLALQLRDSFHKTPVYLALGNNDSGCGNYHQTPGSPFLHTVDDSIAANFTLPEDRKRAVRAFSDRGDYSVLLPRSMHRTRLIILQNVYGTPSYGSCDGGGDTDKAAVLQMDWLRAQLVSAKKDHQKVWVMAHIAPGIDTYATYHKFVGSPDKLCSVATPTLLLSSDALTRTLTDFAPIVKLAIFGHTHMDEIKLLHNAAGANVAAKLVPSVSPVNGNVPSFLVATVQPRTAVMLDYAVFAASDLKATWWSEEYRYSKAYHLPDYSADSVAQIASRFATDRTADNDLSATYLRWFFPGDDGQFARGLKTVWPGYACAVAEDGGPSFQDCLCGKTASTTTKAAQ